jgi:orotate phosphoribosyltransferase
MKAELIDLLLDKSFQYSETPVFRLVSGRLSRYYVNCKPITLNPKGMVLCGHLVYGAIKARGIRGVGGLTFGADPIAVATAFTSQLHDDPINAFSIRKNRKDHGTAQWLEGDLSRGDPVAVIDDVVTTGGSTIAAIERAREAGLDVVKAVVLVDRQEGGLAAVKNHVPEVTVIVTREELMQRLGQRAAGG